MDNGGIHISVEHLFKTYGQEIVLDDLSLELTGSRIYCLMAPSGAGKTTLFRILMGLENPDSGTIRGLSGHNIAAVFQEDRLMEGYTAVQNLRFVTGRRYSSQELTSLLARILPADSLEKPVCEFSGGMKRRTAILRAILAPSDFVIMDEPFAGLDRETKLTVMELIKEYTKGKLLLLSTHSEEDASLLGGTLIRLNCRSKPL